MYSNDEADSIDFAIYLNEKAKQKEKHINMTKIHKWLYICYGLYLALYQKPLLDELPQAWDYGPVFPRVHNKQKKNANSLDGLARSKQFRSCEEYDEVIDATLGHLGDWTASELVAWTHEKGKAWDKKYNSARYEAMDNFEVYMDFMSYVK